MGIDYSGNCAWQTLEAVWSGVWGGCDSVPKPSYASSWLRLGPGCPGPEEMAPQPRTGGCCQPLLLGVTSVLHRWAWGWSDTPVRTETGTWALGWR